MNEQKYLPPTDCDRSLIEACNDIAGCLRPSGKDDQIHEWCIYDESFRRLVTWAEENGCYYEGLQPLIEGGREHDLTFVEQGSFWLKFTKPSAAGYVVSFDLGMPELQPALPLEYLERLILQNELFADEIRFVGVAGTRQQPRIVTRQPHVAGEAASFDAIIATMVDVLEYSILPKRFAVGYADSLAFVRDDIAVFDLRPANVVCTTDGLISPIDAIPVKLCEIGKRILRGESH